MFADRREFAAIFAGSFIGAIARAELGLALPHDDAQRPWATFSVNIVGAFLLGYFAISAAGAPAAVLLTGGRSWAPGCAGR